MENRSFGYRKPVSDTPRASRGYVLLGLLLTMALLIIAAAVVVPSITFEIRRDREEELIHRGAQYSRAIRAYVKKSGRYPTRIEELQQPGGLKFLRKAYKDPITGGDFRLLHMNDITGLPSGIPNLNSSSSSPNDSGQPDSNSGDNPDSSNESPNPDDASNGQPAAQKTPATPPPGTPPTLKSIGTMNTGAPSGLLIVGVASKSKSQSIREFDHKNHYKDWLFFFDPKYDRGQEIKGPTSLTPLPAPQVGTPVQNLQPGQAPGAPNPNPPQPPSDQPQQQQ